MSELSELYQQVILDHNKKPRNFRKLEGANRSAEGVNPLCGDHLTVYMQVEGDEIKDVSFEGTGCAISKASASMMTQAVKGKKKAAVGKTHPAIVHNSPHRESETLKLQAIELREIRLPLVHFFETSFGRTNERRILLARVRDRDGAEGWGECTAGEGPFYSEEWIESAWVVLKAYLAPMLLAQEFAAPADVSAILRRVRGNRMAKATLETACWDLA